MKLDYSITNIGDIVYIDNSIEIWTLPTNTITTERVDDNTFRLFARDLNIPFTIDWREVSVPDYSLYANIDDFLLDIDDITSTPVGAPTGPAGGELSGTYPNPAVLNSAVLAKLLTGLSVSGGSIAATDNIITAFGKVQSQLNSVLGGVIYISTYNATPNTPTLIDGTGTKGNYYVVSVAGTQNYGSGALIFNIGDWVIYNGTIWQKVDNTDAVISVNGIIGAVVLTTADITEITNLYFTTARVLATAITGYTSSSGIIADTDTILQAIQKLNGNIALKANLISPALVTPNIGAATGTSLNLADGFTTNEITITKLIPDTLPSAPSAGNKKMYTRSILGISTLMSMGSGGNELTFFQDNTTPVYNTEVGSVVRGQPVVLLGATSGRPNLVLAQGNTNLGAQVAGLILSASIAPGSTGLIQFTGQLTSVDTSMFAVGDILYLSTVTPGLLTNVSPGPTELITKIGLVLVSSATVGVINLDIVNAVPQPIAVAHTPFYFTSTDSTDIAGYDQIVTSPNTSAEVIYTGTGVQNVKTLIKAFATEAGSPSVVSLPAGAWIPQLYASVNNSGGTNTLTCDVYKRATGGAETLLYSVTTPNLTTVATQYNLTTTQSAFTLLSTDRLVFKISYTTSNDGHITSFYTQDGTHNSVIVSTLAAPVGTELQANKNTINGYAGLNGNGTVPITIGGTGATNVSDARTNLGLGTLATQNGTFTDKADLASPTFTGIPLAPSPVFGTDTAQLATTEFVQDAIDSVVVKVANFAALPVTGDANVLYIANLTEQYSWNGTSYDYLNPPTIPDTSAVTLFADTSTTTALAANTYANGTLGVGATLTGNANGALASQDGVAIVVGLIILVKNEVSTLKNGLYDVTQIGTGGTPYILTRNTDSDESAELFPSQVNVLGGSTNANKYFLQKTDTPTVGTSAIIYDTIATPAAPIAPLSFVATATGGVVLPTTPVYANGTDAAQPALNATYTAGSNAVFPTFNGVVPYLNMTILVMGQADAKKNGDYTLITVGSGSVKWKLRRIGYSPSTLYGKEWMITEGTSLGNRYIQTTKTLALATIGSVGNIVFINDLDIPLGLKANLASPIFTGTPTLPTGTIATTQSPGNNTTAIATTAFVTAAVAAVSGNPSSPIWTKYTVSYTAFTAAATSESINLLSLLTKQKITGINIRTVTAYVGTSITAATLEIGIVGNTTKHMDAFNVFATGDQELTVNFTESYTAATDIKLTMRLVGGNLTAGSAGSFEIYVKTEQLP